MKEIKQHSHKKTVLLQWVITGIIILLIPFISIVINFVIGRKIINKQAGSSNRLILSHMKDAIDDKLKSIRNLSYLLLLDNDILELSAASGEDDFWSKAQLCYEKLENYTYIYNDMNIIIYYPARDYILTSGVSNSAASIYKAIKYSYSGEMPSYEDWMKLIDGDYSKSAFFLNQFCNYTNIGKKSFVFACTNPFVYRESANYNILVSSTADFIDSDLAQLSERTFFICNQEGEILYQFGAPLELGDSSSSPLLKSNGPTRLNGQDFLCYSESSSTTGWTYVLCTPGSLYLQDSIMMRNITLISTLASLIIGIMIILFTQYRNYQPVKKLVDIIPSSIKADDTNEFKQLELYHGEMSRRNLFMQNKLEHISRNVRELYFYSKLKGVSFHTQEKDIISTLNLDFSGKSFLIASLYADTHSFSENDVMRNWDLLQFAITNISDELLGSSFAYEHIQDEFFHVFFFTMDEAQKEHWTEAGTAAFLQLSGFFRTQFGIELFILLSPMYENFEQTTGYYTDIIASFEEYYAKNLPGVYEAAHHTESASSGHARLTQYSRKISLAIFQNDYEMARETAHQYIGELESCHFSTVLVRYHVYSLMVSIVIDTGDYIGHAAQDMIDGYFADSLYGASLEDFEAKLDRLLLLLCNQSNPVTDNTQSKDGQIIRKIKNYVDNYYADVNLNVGSVAEAMGLSSNYVSKLFKSVSNEGLLSYINHVRISHAKELLRTTSLTVDEIAPMAGFSNTRSFRRNFQNTEGITASDYRNGNK